MDCMPFVREGATDDTEWLVALFADAFAEDPVMNWVIPATELYPDFFRVLVAEIYLPRGIVHVEEEERGAALWLPPGEKFELSPGWALVRMVARLVLRKGPHTLLRIRQQGRLFESHHPRRPHYYLQFIGVRRASQGQGVGSTLLKQGTRICDQEGMPAYLESSNPLNVPLYQRHGFEVVEEVSLPGNGPSAWFMWREPR